MEFINQIRRFLGEDEKILFQKDFNEFYSVIISNQHLFQFFNKDEDSPEDIFYYEEYLKPEIKEIYNTNDNFVEFKLKYLRRVGMSCKKKWRKEYWALNLYFTHPQCPNLEKNLSDMTHLDHEMFNNCLFYDIGPFIKLELIETIKIFHETNPEIIIDPFYEI